MKCISFNINSIRARLHQLEALIEKHDPDFIGLQETKVVDAEFPEKAVAELGYHALFHGQKTHYGVAILSKVEPLKVQKGFSTDDPKAQRRMISATFEVPGFGEVDLINGYFPQGENRDHEIKFPAKKKFYEDLQDHLNTQYRQDRHLVLMGDFNIAPSDLDIGIGSQNAKRWLRTGKCSFLPEERAWMSRLMDWGFVDTFRQHYPDVDNRFSWFDYRSRGFEADPKRGLRIDMILANANLAARCRDTGIDYELRGIEKPSDHCPIWSTFE